MHLSISKNTLYKVIRETSLYIYLHRYYLYPVRVPTSWSSSCHSCICLYNIKKNIMFAKKWKQNMKIFVNTIAKAGPLLVDG